MGKIVSLIQLGQAVGSSQRNSQRNFIEPVSSSGSKGIFSGIEPVYAVRIHALCLYSGSGSKGNGPFLTRIRYIADLRPETGKCIVPDLHVKHERKVYVRKL